MAMSGYTKLFNSILASTIWREPNHVRIVWITLLAMADKHGVAEGSVPGLADFARVSIDDCRDALAKLQSPDEDSRSQDFDGRRIMPIEGGWQILNHAKYRQKVSEDERREYLRVKQSEYRARKSTNVDNVSDKSTEYTQAEAEAEAETDQRQKAEAVPAPKRHHAPGPLAGSLPRDHIDHAWCGERFCLTHKMAAQMARAYGEGGEEAVSAWVRQFHDTLGGGSFGGPTWLLKHWDAHLVESGRVQPAPATQTQPKRRSSWKGIAAELDAAEAAKRRS